MRIVPVTAGATCALALLALALLALAASCGGARPISAADLLATQSDGSGTIARTFECLKKDAEGNCLRNQCKQGPGGATFDCGSFGKACVDAGLHWKGTQQGGVCSVPGHQE